MSKERRFADETGMVMSQLGMTPASGRLLGWLLICDPPAQTSAQLAEALDLSKGSVSTGMRMLEQIGLVARVPTPGRGHAYEIRADALVRTTDPRGKYLLMKQAMDNGLVALGDEDGPRAQRLRVTRDFFAFVADRIPAIMDEFEATYLKGK